MALWVQIRQGETLNHQGAITHEVCCLAPQFHSNWSKLALQVKIVFILWVAQHVKTGIFFSAWYKSRVKWDNTEKEDLRTIVAYLVAYEVFGCWKRTTNVCNAQCSKQYILEAFCLNLMSLKSNRSGPMLRVCNTGAIFLRRFRLYMLSFMSRFMFANIFTNTWYNFCWRLWRPEYGTTFKQILVCIFLSVWVNS